MSGKGSHRRLGFGQGRAGQAPIRPALAWRLLAALLPAVPAWGGHIHDAAYRGDLERVQSLVENDPDRVRQQDEHGRTALHIAAENRNEAMATYLIEHGADVNAKDAHGQTPLHAFVSGASKLHPIADLLVTHGADVNARDQDGNTPLHEAMRRKDAADLAAYLIAHGARTDLVNKRGETPMARADEQRREGIEGLVGKHGGTYWIYALYLVGGLVAMMFLFWVFLRMRP